MRVTSSGAFNRLVVFTLSRGPALLRALLEPPAGSGRPPSALLFRPEAQPRWKKVEPLARSFLGNALHLLGQLSDAAMAAFALSSLVPCAPFAQPFPRLTKLLLRAALLRFGEGAPEVRLQALRLLRALALVLPPPGRDAVFRGAYRTFAANAKFAGAAQLESVSFMAASLTELFSLDPGGAYPLAFAAIRQLALLLRTALTARSGEAHRAVYCWQSVHCLELWGRVLTAHAGQPSDALRPLVHPLAQLLQGCARLLPAARHAPLRLRLLASLQRLGAATGLYVPLAHQLTELLGCSELAKPPLSRSAAATDYGCALRVPKAQLRCPAFHAFLVERSLDLMTEALAQWAYHPAFPEMAHLCLRELRRFAKASPAPRFQRPALQLAEAVLRNIEWVARKREACDFAPKDCAPGAPALAAFLAAERAAGEAPLMRALAARRALAAQRAAAQVATEVRVADGDDSDEEGGGEEEAPTRKRRSEAPQAVKKRRKTQAHGEAAGGSGDLVVPLELSDEE